MRDDVESPAAAAIVPVERVRRQSRAARGMGARGVTLDIDRHQAERLTAAEVAELERLRPRTRAECIAAPRPCPWAGCRHHLYLDVNDDTGSVKVNFPDRQPGEMAESCSLDVADRGDHTLEDVGLKMNLTRERMRQVEVRALLKVRMASPSRDEVGADLLRPTPPAVPRVVSRRGRRLDAETNAGVRAAVEADPSRSDADIGREFRVSPGVVARHRRRLGIDPNPAKHGGVRARKNVERDRSIADRLLGGEGVATLAAELGLTCERIYQIAADHGISMGPDGAVRRPA